MSFKYGYMTQRSAFFAKAGDEQELPAQKEGAELLHSTAHPLLQEI
jgi:hypothetical protein